MDTNQTLENMLNLALETPFEERVQTENLNVGYNSETRSWELIVKYNGDLTQLKELGVLVEELIAGYAILQVPEELVDEVAGAVMIEYVEKPKRLFFAAREGLLGSCFFQVTERPPFLSGEGVLVAIIDSGIDYENNLFRKEDGNSRILYLWDQTLEREFGQEQINEALRLRGEGEAGFPGNRQAAYNVVPSIDVSGHGTAVAAIAAGNGTLEGRAYQGAAPESELIVVKLGLPGETSFPRTTELMRALVYVVRKAQELGRPVAVNVSFGNTYGAHNGSSLLERFLENVSEIGRNVICVGAGNEGAGRGHIQGVANERTFVELEVGNYESTLNVQIWKNYVDEFRILLQSPGGEVAEVPSLSENAGKRVVVLENTRILIYLGEPAPYASVQEIYFDFIPVGQRGRGSSYIVDGVWTFTLEPIKVVTGRFYFYLPSATVRSQNTGFFRSTPEITLTIPSTCAKVITVGAYDTTYDAYADFSGRGYVYESRTIGLVLPGGVKPDLVAPGVNILVPDVRGGSMVVSGTSFATPFVTGAAALLMEWGIVRGNDRFLYGEKVKAYLRNGARPLRGEENYPNEKVGWGALCVAESIPM